MNAKLLIECQRYVAKYRWKLLKPEELVSKVAQVSSNPKEWQFLICREYFAYIHELLTDNKKSKQKRSDAAEELWRYVESRSHAFGRQKGMTDINDLEELASEAMFKIWINLDKVQSNFLAFCFNKIRGAWTDGLEAKKQFPTAVHSGWTHGSQQRLNNLIDDALVEQVRLVMSYKLLHYPRGIRKQLLVILMLYGDEMTPQEIAVNLGTNTNNIYQMKNRAIKVLRENKQMRKLNECW